MNRPDNFTVGVIISTYNNPAWLEKAFWGYMAQTRRPDEIVVADDGSGDETRELIERYKTELPLKHVWHEDKGFRKTRILNAAVLAAESDYLIFADQDLIPRCDFVEAHVRRAEYEHFLSGGTLLLPMDTSKAITRDDVLSGNVFDRSWLRAHGMPCTFKQIKLVRSRLLAWLFNHITTRRATWNGGNASTWRKDILAVNGFNERMFYGGEDREFGERLQNAGFRSKQLVYSAVTLHLDHKRPYRDEELIRKNREIRADVRRRKVIKTPYGIRHLRTAVK